MSAIETITTSAAAMSDTVDRLTARRYTHPALSDQPIVRLVPAALGEAEDLALEFLGLAREGEPVQVGRTRQEALGFPAWALVNDPANGHHALALVKEMERLARQARTKPGAAKEGFEQLADELGRSVPHFLPTYLEQVGRVMLDVDNKTYAAAFFDKARQAEQVHNLELDEDRLRAVFVEFALSGALTVKALRRYVKDLSVRLDGARAWEGFRQLCVERSAAGMPPYAGLAEDTRSLLRRAGLPKEAAAAAERELLWELLCSPAIGRAPAAFWTSWRERLIELTAGDPARAGEGGPSAAEVRRRLLELLPTPSGESSWRPSRFTPSWLELLSATGTESLLTGAAAPGPDGETEGLEAGAPAAWLSRWAGHLIARWGSSERSAESIALVDRMTDRLRRDGVLVALFASVPPHRYAVLLDLLDVLLAADVPVTLPDNLQQLDLMPWLDDRTPGARDLTALAADPVLRPVLRRAVGQSRYRSHGQPTRPAVTVPVLAELLGEWVDEQLELLDRCHGLTAADEILAALTSWRSQLTEIRPEAAERIARLDVGALLGRTLRAGIVDELGWPALEKTCAVVEGDRHRAPGLRGLGVTRPPAALAGRERVGLTEAWPALIAHRGDAVAVAGPDQVLLVHHTRSVQQQHSHWDSHQFRFADGELLVAWHDQKGRWRAYWSARPEDEFELTGVTPEYPWQIKNHISLPAPDGGRTTGNRPLRAGDTAMPRRRQVWGDGIGHWVLGGDGTREVWAEFDAATGARGRASLPPWLSASSRLCEAPLEVPQCEVLPLQPGQEHTPLGTDGSLVGRWVRRDGDRNVLGTPDGRVLTFPNVVGPGPVLPIGLLRLPGGAELVLVQRNIGLLEVFRADGQGRQEELLGRFNTTQSGGLAAAGTGVVVAPQFWHNLRPRDEQGSQALRELTDVQAAALLAAARPRDHQPGEEQTWLVVAGARLPRTRTELTPLDEVAELLPQVTDPLLRAGVAGHVLHAVALLARAAAFRPTEAAEGSEGGAKKRLSAPPRREQQYRPALGDDYRIRMLTQLSPGYHVSPGSESWTALNQLRAVVELMRPATPTTDGSTASSDADVPLKKERVALAAGWTEEKYDIGQSHAPWVPLLHRLPDLTLRAVSMTTEADARVTLRLLLDDLLRLPLTAAGTLREVVLSEEVDSKASKNGGRRGTVLRHGERTVVIIDQECWSHQSRSWLAVDHDPSGQFGQVAAFATDREHRVEAHRDPALLRAYVERGAAQGPAGWHPEAVQALEEGTGVGPGLAALLLAGAPPQGTQELPGFTKAEAAVASGRLRQRNSCAVSSVLAALLPEDSDLLWSVGPDVAAGAARWTERFGRRTWLPESLATAVNGADLTVIDALLDVEHTPWLNRTTVQRMRSRTLANGHSYSEFAPEDPSALPGGHVPWNSVQNALRWLAYHLPYGHPLRARLPKALQAVRARLTDPGLLLDLHVSWNDKGQPTAPALRAAFGAPETGGGDADGILQLGEALVLVPMHGRDNVRLRPAALSGPHDPILDLLLGHSGGDRHGEVGALRGLLGPEVERLVEAGAALSSTPRPAQDALLALPDPADRKVAAWTGWKPARLKAARTELLAADGLVVEAKRARAGRALFLPGGWQESRSPGIPMETWKSGLYPLSTGVARWPDRPVPELFAEAWRRVRLGEAPGYVQPVSPSARRTTRKAAR
jgi:hypothetical protein